jgi:hypothetical protein
MWNSTPLTNDQLSAYMGNVIPNWVSRSTGSSQNAAGGLNDMGASKASGLVWTFATAPVETSA